MIALLLALTLQQAQLVPVIPVEDDEIAFSIGAERTFQRAVADAVARKPWVRDILARRGVEFLCWQIELKRAPLTAKYFPPYRRALAAVFREGTSDSVVFSWVRGAEWELGKQDYQRRLDLVAAKGQILVEHAANALVDHLIRAGEYAPAHVADRPGPAGMAEFDKTPELLTYWCSLSPKQRERVVGGYLKEGE
ncbi:hypothetical protein J2W22_002105 [Sphingomonas kyeonggiensis]|uniref:hypothetical protein n=1 Tax=Sphingomonas kyeonggiensis TaxID=1268553 RepID=UPI00277E04EF|nr:hypothetical protein [Sphingomonas kyeonggiensis]MDQ0250041.1 hypothetical protein [Sphingomonas kyeonggiensis]